MTTTTRDAARFRHERVADPREFDRASFRTVTVDKHRVVVACPKGQWDPRAPQGQQCRGPLRAVTILHPLGERTCANPLLAILNPRAAGGRRMGTAVYEITYQHADDPADGPARRHVFDRPENVELWQLSDDQVLMRAQAFPLVGWFDG